jgi:hypothetical protein
MSALLVGYARCSTVYVFLGRERIGSARPAADGSSRLRGLSVPGSMRPGRYELTTSCASTGRPVVHASGFDVTATRWHRSGWVTALPRPGHVDWSLRSVMTSAAATAAMVALVGFPSQLFDRTLDENYEEVRGWFGVSTRAREPSRARRLVASGAFLVMAAFLTSLLDPTFGFSAASLQTYVGHLASSIVMLVLFSAPTLVFMRRRFDDRGELRARPGTLLLAGTFVAASRLLHLNPGYLYGLLAGFEHRTSPPSRTRACLAAANLGFLLLVGTGAWFAWSAVADRTSVVQPSVPLLLLESTLAALFVGGLVSATFSLVPIQLLDGKDVVTWSRLLWAALFAVAAFLLIHVLLRPSGGYVARSSAGSLTAAFIGFALFAAFSVAFWAYFRYRSPRPGDACGRSPAT